MGVISDEHDSSFDLERGVLMHATLPPTQKNFFEIPRRGVEESKDMPIVLWRQGQPTNEATDAIVICPNHKTDHHHEEPEVRRLPGKTRTEPLDHTEQLSVQAPLLVPDGLLGLHTSPRRAYAPQGGIVQQSSHHIFP
jgi:hypothetical protein